MIYIYIYVRFIHWMCGVFRSLADTAHTRRHLPIGGSVADKGGVTYIAAYSSPTRRRGVALPEMVLQLDGVAWSPRRLRWWPTVMNTAHTRRHISIVGSVCWSGWSRLYRRTQQSYWVVWSRAARNVFFVDGGMRFSYRCFRDKKQNNRRLNQLPIRTGT